MHTMLNNISVRYILNKQTTTTAKKKRWKYIFMLLEAKHTHERQRNRRKKTTFIIDCVTYTKLMFIKSNQCLLTNGQNGFNTIKGGGGSSWAVGWVMMQYREERTFVCWVHVGSQIKRTLYRFVLCGFSP